MFSSFLPVVRCTVSPPFMLSSNVYSTDTSHFVYSSVSWQVFGLFLFGGFLSKNTVTSCARVLRRTYVCISLCWSVDLLAHLRLHWAFWRSTTLISKVSAPQNSVGGFQLLHILDATSFCLERVQTVWRGTSEWPWFALSWWPAVWGYVEYALTCLLAIHKSLEKHLLRSFACFKIDCLYHWVLCIFCIFYIF